MDFYNIRQDFGEHLQLSLPVQREPDSYEFIQVKQPLEKSSEFGFTVFYFEISEKDVFNNNDFQKKLNTK